jgi:hypothetical protein
VGGDAVSYCPTNALEAWQARVLEVLASDPASGLELRVRQAALYSWQAHVETIVSAHERAYALGKR